MKKKAIRLKPFSCTNTTAKSRFSLLNTGTIQQVCISQLNKNFSRSPTLQGPVYMEKSCPGQEGHPPSRVNFTARLYEKKVDPFAGAKS